MGGIDQIHHVLYWLDAEYSKDRNDANKLVWLCNKCHDILHSRGGNDYREFTKQYLWF